jgi:hypothetical protein
MKGSGRCRVNRLNRVKMGYGSETFVLLGSYSYYRYIPFGFYLFILFRSDSGGLMVRFQF